MNLRRIFLLLVLIISILPINSSATGSEVVQESSITICKSKRTGFQYIAYQETCSERTHDKIVWYPKGSLTNVPTTSKVLSLKICQNLLENSLKVIRHRCYSKTELTINLERAIGIPIAPVVTSVTYDELGSATLTLTASKVDGGSKISSYTIIASPGDMRKTIPVSQINKVVLGGLRQGVAYTFTTIATNSVGSSLPSLPTQALVSADVPITPSIMKVESTATDCIRLTFDITKKIGASPITNLIAIANPGGIRATSNKIDAGYIDIDGLNPSTKYTFTLIAVNRFGNSEISQVSQEVSTKAIPVPEPVYAPAPTPAPSLASPAFTLSASSESRAASSAATGFTINSTGGTIASFSISPSASNGMSFNTTTGAFSGTPTSAASAVTYTVTATNASGSATREFVFTVIASYSIGSVGPGGGRVFYYKEAGFNCGATFTNSGSPTGGLCHYLEAAPTTGASLWGTSGYDNELYWSGNSNTLLGTVNSLDSIGAGYYNTLKIIEQSSTANRAATASQAYRGPNNLADWYLPSIKELRQLCKWSAGLTYVNDDTICSGGTGNSGTGAAGFVSNFPYWSSTEASFNYAYAHWFVDSSGSQTQVSSGKSSSLRVRPIRAF